MTTDQRPGVTTQPVDVHVALHPDGSVYGSINDPARRLHWEATGDTLIEILGSAEEYINRRCLGWPDMNLIGLEGLA